MQPDLNSDTHPQTILLGVCGGIAAYKSVELARRLSERARVKVVMTAAAQRFVTPLSFETVTGNPVNDDSPLAHIELARWAQCICIAPATAHMIAKLSAGLADDLLSTLCLAAECPMVVVPAMNRAMWENPATRANVRVLLDRGVRILGPEQGDQACGETGFGRMMEPHDIMAHLLGRPLLAGLHVMVTAGPTREAIDPVRFISNASSGRMGFALARQAAALGARVTLVSGPVALDTPAGVDRIDVVDTAQMHAGVMEHLSSVDIFVGAAAVSDYRPGQAATEKIKKTEATLMLELARNPDILQAVAADGRVPWVVGFAAETSDLKSHALNKMQKKKCHMIIANLVGGDRGGFDSGENAVTVYWRGGEKSYPLTDKNHLARSLWSLIHEQYHQSQNQSGEGP